MRLILNILRSETLAVAYSVDSGGLTTKVAPGNVTSTNTSRYIVALDAST